jgi:8-oxo-dGTP diphosphatase
MTDDDRMVRYRRRGTAIVETPKGILMVSQLGRRYTLPGGGAWPTESRLEAAKRELMEETTMVAVDGSFLFEYRGLVHKGPRGGLFRNAHKVFLMTATGVPEPRNEVKYVAYYDGSNLSLSFSAKKIIAMYRAMRAVPAPDHV